MRATAMSLGLLVTVALAGACEHHTPAPDARSARSARAAPSGSSSSHAGTAAPAAPPRAPFVVAIVVDQLSAWVAASRLPELPRGGGFARLMREGTWLETVRFPYALTDTGPGHAALQTGKVPAESGIVGNEIPDASGHRVSALRDATVKPVLPDGPHPGVGSSAARLEVDTVADRLRAAHADALVVSVSVKDRGAILPGGKRPSHVLWFEATFDSFVTSTAFAQTYPAWALGVGDTKAVAAARAKPWELTDAAWVKARSLTPDRQPGEGDLDGLGVTFPHVARTAAAFRATPASDEVVVRLGLAAIAADYDPRKPTLLLLSLSAADLIGHVFGPDSWEAWDHLRKLDATLGALLDALDARAGAPVHVLLTGDHGNISMPELAASRPGCARPASVPPATLTSFGWPCTSGERVGPTALQAELVASAKRALGPGTWIAGFADSIVFLTAAARALPEARRAVLDRAIRATLAKHKGIAEVYDARMLVQTCPSVLASAEPMPSRATSQNRDGVLTLVCRTGAPGAGDYFVVLAPGSFLDGEVVIGKGTSHGTPYLYDRTVPLLVRAPGAVDAGAVVGAPVDFAVFAALEAAFLGLDTRAPRDILTAHGAGAARAP